jgi:hypothetical protein
MWKNIIDAKYRTASPNIFCCNPRNSSPFWKGVLWATQVAKMGLGWNVRDGRKVRFWEDQWFETCSLAIQYWKIYLIVNEQGYTIREAWDGENLKFSLRRTLNSRIMQIWLELVEIARCILLTDEEDVMIWQFNSSGMYSVQSLYVVMRKVFTPVIWKIPVPNPYFCMAPC